MFGQLDRIRVMPGLDTGVDEGGYLKEIGEMTMLVLICNILDALSFRQDGLTGCDECSCRSLQFWQGAIDQVIQVRGKCVEGRTELLLCLVNVDESACLRDAEI